MSVELDYLFLAAHPDDAELFCGGTIVKMHQRGYAVGILDFSEGEMATHGTVAERQAETKTANAILKPAYRHNLGLPDSALCNDRATQSLVIDVIRETRAKVLVAPLGPCRHPDHNAVHQLSRDVHFLSGMGKFPSAHPPWRPLRLMFHLELQERTPSFIIDISEQFTDRMAAVNAYASQFHVTDAEPAKQTLIGSKAFRERLEARLRHYGSLINCRYGEPYVVDEVLRVDDPLTNVREG